MDKATNGHRVAAAIKAAIQGLKPGAGAAQYLRSGAAAAAAYETIKLHWIYRCEMADDLLRWSDSLGLCPDSSTEEIQQMLNELAKNDVLKNWLAISTR